LLKVVYDHPIKLNVINTVISSHLFRKKASKGNEEPNTAAWPMERQPMFDNNQAST